MEREPRLQFWTDALEHDHDAWWNGPVHLIILLLLIALLAIAVVLLVRELRGPGAEAALPVAAAGAVATAAPAPADPAVAALRLRYARGEIGRDDFQRALEDLAGPTPSWPGGTVDESAPTGG